MLSSCHHASAGERARAAMLFARALHGYGLTMGLAELVAYLRTLPDDWASWLVYADALSERGDARGQLLVLAHSLRTRAGDDAAMRAELEGLEDAWMVTWGDQLRPDDGDRYDQHRRLAPLGRGAPTPGDLLPILGRPMSQLLALLEPGELSTLDVSPIFELHHQQVIAAVLAWIERAFDGVSPPDEDHTTLHQAEAADNYEGCDRSRDFLGRWQEFPDDQLLANQWALPHLDEQGIHYYVPAVMSFALRHHEAGGWLTESLEYTLQPSSAPLRDYQQQRFSLLDRGQRAAIYAYSLIRGHAEAWSRVFEAERHEERADWFEIYSPR